MNDRLQPPLNNLFSNGVYHNNGSGQLHFQDNINLNELVQSITQAYTVEGNSLFILRLDKLPVVVGERQVLTHLFATLLAMMVNHPPANSKLFMYIKCVEEQDEPDILDLRVTEGTRMYQMHFHTNINTDEGWQLFCKDRLAECGLIAQQHKGNFNFHTISNTGCLFSLTLPGKLN